MTFNFFEIWGRVKFWINADRIGPDMPITHWCLYWKSTSKSLCTKKFKYFGEGAEFRPGAYAEACSKIEIGRNVVVRPGSFLFADPTEGGGGIVIEDKVLIGSGVHFYTNNHKFSDTTKPIYDQAYQEPTIKNSIRLRSGCWIGANVVILAGIEIGENAVVGAGSVVTKSVAAYTVVAGNPARIIKNISRICDSN